MKASRSGEKKVDPFSLNAHNDDNFGDDSSERSSSMDSSININSNETNDHPLEEKFINKN